MSDFFPVWIIQQVFFVVESSILSSCFKEKSATQGCEARFEIVWTILNEVAATKGLSVFFFTSPMF